MTKWKRIILTGCCVTTLAIGAAITADAETTAIQTESAGSETPAILAPFLVYGNIEKLDGERLFLTNSASDASYKEVVITTENSKILDAVTGMPVSYDSLTDGQIVYAYIGPAMTMSLPPISNAELILCQIPADFKVPDYVEIKGVVADASSGTAVLTTTAGVEYEIAQDCQILPYLTRNMVTLSDLNEGKKCLIWSDDDNVASKIVLFASEEQPIQQEG